MKFTSTKTLLATAALAMSTALTAFAQSVPNSVTISNVIWGGNGCTQTNAAVQITPDKKQFTLLFDDYIAEKDSGVVQNRKICNVQAILNVPSGWSYSLVAVEYAGYYYLERGVNATQISTYRFVDPANPFSSSATFQSTFRGPKDDSYFFTDKIGVVGNVWSPCSVKRPLQISTELRISGPKPAYGIITLDQMTGAVNTQYHQTYYLNWKKC